jgi:predicted Zn-dependent protease
MNRLYRAPTFFLVSLLLLITPTTPAAAQQPRPAGSSSDSISCASGSDSAEYTEKDKKLLAEITQRPAVQERIRQAWEEQRQADMNKAYVRNKSAEFTTSDPSEALKFRLNFGQLYDSPTQQRYVNSLGQQLVPTDSPNVYSFKLLFDPVPSAESLSTGTVYVSTGLVSALDNEAQLSYILAHEIAHVERKHLYNILRNQILDEELDKERTAQAERSRAKASIFGALAGAAIGGAAGGWSGVAMGTAIGGIAGTAIGHAAFRNQFQRTEWCKLYEDEADETGLKIMLDHNYDAREIPRLYARLNGLVSRDARVALGFVAKPERIRERTANVQNLLTTTHKAEIEQRLQSGGLKGSGPDFALLMSALKRDNGILAFEYDLYAMARDNLEEAANLRSNDPRVHYYLGRVIAMTGRTPQDTQAAIAAFQRGMQYDAQRGEYPELHLENALHLISQNNPANQPEIQSELKTYVALYQRNHAGGLPPNMPIIYDDFLLAGDTSWYVPPAAVVSTKNVDALYVTPVAAAPPTATGDVVGRATGRVAEQATPWAPPPSPRLQAAAALQATPAPAAAPPAATPVKRTTQTTRPKGTPRP